MVVFRNDWSTIGRQNLQDAIGKGFAEKNCSVRLLDADIGINEELAEIQSLYKVVNKSIRLQAYGHCLQYLLGTMHEPDAFLIINF